MPIDGLPFRLVVKSIPKCQRSRWQADSFHYNYFTRDKPVKYSWETYVTNPRNTLPAYDAWFVRRKTAQLKQNPSLPPRELNYDYLSEHGDFVVPIERTVWGNRVGKHPWEWPVESFETFSAPFSVFMDWTKQKLANPEGFAPNESLYIAQCSLYDLPSSLLRDVPPPVYALKSSDEKSPSVKRENHLSLPKTEATSLWMGIAPTETPLHADPLSNFFLQLAGKKTVRMLDGPSGAVLLQWVKRQTAAQQNMGRLDISMRGEEMMAGPERALMSEIIWGPDNFLQRDEKKDDKAQKLIMHETVVGDGESIFIPRQFYHAVRSFEEEVPSINVSVNWWFSRTGPGDYEKMKARKAARSNR